MLAWVKDDNRKHHHCERNCVELEKKFLGVSVCYVVSILCCRYHNIYTSEGVTLHKLALQLQERLNSNEFGNANVSSFSDYPNLTSSGNLMVVYAGFSTIIYLVFC
jgi:hypothetical protein